MSIFILNININMSQTYKISQFISIMEMAPADAITIFRNDTWFPSTNSRYIRYVVDDNKIVSLERSNQEKEGFIKIDSSMNPKDFTIQSELTENQLASVIFSVNGNKGVFILLKGFIKKIKSVYSDYHSCISNRNMKIFCTHIAWLRANIGDSDIIPEWIFSDPLFSKMAIEFEKMHSRKIKIYDLPSLDNGMNIYSHILFLIFMMIKDRVYHETHLNLNINVNTQIIKNLEIDIAKFNEVCSLEC
jgi:hypothetical protein